MFDIEFFPGKNLSGLFKDIYTNQVNKKKYISDLITDLRKMIENPKDMVIIGPLLKDLIKTSLDNDDVLLKMATLGQRLYNASSKMGNSEDAFLTEEERKQLLAQLDTFQKEVDKMPDKDEVITAVKTKLNKK